MPRSTDKPRITVIIPAHDEEANLDRLLQRLRTALEPTGCPLELLLVDDGSTDGTAERWRRLRETDPRLALVRLARNFGKEAALLAGFRHATGDVVVPVDADLQDPPELIPELLVRWREGWDVVYGVRRSRSDPLWKRASAACYHRLLGYLATVPIPVDAGDFRLLDRSSVDALLALPESDRYTKGLYAWIGGRQCAVAYDRPPRADGEPSQGLGRLLSLALDGITGFTESPLRALLWTGLAICLCAAAYGTTWLTLYITGTRPSVPGYPSLLLFILFFGGLNLAALGVIGEYLARIYREVKRRPPYLVAEALSASPSPPGSAPGSAG